jgi:hypothetical protein
VTILIALNLSWNLFDAPIKHERHLFTCVVTYRHERCGRGYADCQDRKLFDNMTNLSKLIKRSAMTSKMRSRLADTGKTSTIL